MADIVVGAYLVGLIVTTLCAYIAAKRFEDRYSPARGVALISVVAGLLWPLVLLGLIELSSVMMLTKRPPTEQPVAALVA